MKTAILWAGALTLAFAGPVAADPGKNNAKGKGNAGHSTMQNGNKPATTRNSDARNARSDRNGSNGRLYALDARGSCPPGLAKKNNGCTPPGPSQEIV